ncbi:hypothetical protein HYPSUDRAFT_417492 [Hypholoma sublateritium FD-334 SS-4]|uniref:Uncharacterized protein n=1 Tax=Hypholoma sublateritium (strain FD-334 SS-4) TaxID=945553 RepID=A0A0D2NDS9_HYPSF|nr:hypothetical protein HYPSUDRAFT_417492 [Hypholoma sublateritium FD-334 SS-4]
MPSLIQWFERLYAVVSFVIILSPFSNLSSPLFLNLCVCRIRLLSMLSMIYVYTQGCMFYCMTYNSSFTFPSLTFEALIDLSSANLEFSPLLGPRSDGRLMHSAVLAYAQTPCLSCSWADGVEWSRSSQ